MFNYSLRMKDEKVLREQRTFSRFIMTATLFLDRVTPVLHNIPININLINIARERRPFRKFISKYL